MVRPLVYEKFVYYLLNKPKGVISATEDDRHKTVLDLLDDAARQKEVFPVGRLDVDTHGLLLLPLMVINCMLCCLPSAMWLRFIRLRLPV